MLHKDPPGQFHLVPNGQPQAVCGEPVWHGNASSRLEPDDGLVANRRNPPEDQMHSSCEREWRKLAHGVRVEYLGDPGLASLFAAALEDAGLNVAWDPPEENRGAAQVETQIEFLVTTAASLVAITPTVKAVIARFKDRFPDAAQIVEAPDEDEAN
jgi:hypothetical protein